MNKDICLKLVPLALILAGGIAGVLHLNSSGLPAGGTKVRAVSAASPRDSVPTVKSSAFEHALGGMNVATRPWNGVWLGKYPGVDPTKADIDADKDGVSNYDEMIADTDPFNGKGHLEPNRQATGMPHTPVAETYEDIQARALADLPALRQREQEAQATLVARAEATGTLMLHYDGTDSPAVLKGFDDEGTPVYTESLDAGSADTSGADELWPSGSVTGIAGWNTGGTGYNLDGGLSDPWDTPAADPDPNRPYPTVGMWENSDKILDTHSQLSDLDATGSPRVLQMDDDGSLTPVTHNTRVAGILGGAGITDPLQGSNISLGTLDAGNYARGLAYAGRVNAYDSLGIQSELSAESANTPPLRAANGSYAVRTGWSFDTSVGKWRWFGPNGTAQEDFKFGAYLNGNPAGSSPREMDERSYLAPFGLVVWAGGNNRNDGPGSLAGAGGNYLLTTTSTTSTLPRDWNDGDAGGFDSLPPEATAKNTLSIGAWSDVATEWNASAAEYVTGATGRVSFPVGMGAEATFSSAGPTDDGRLKPDVVACGIRNAGTNPRNPLNLTSVFAPDATSDNYFTQGDALIGTSYAAPVATGGVAMILQRRHAVCRNWENDPNDPYRSPYPIRSSTIRALAVHTAKDVGNAGPDFKTGYGLLSVGDAAKVMNDDCEYAWHFQGGQGPKPCVKEICLKPNTYINFKVKRLSASIPVRVTMAWTDPQGVAHVGTTTDPTTKRLKNDLDLRVFVPGFTPADPTAPGAYSTAIAENTGTNCHKPWQLNPDLAGKSETNRNSLAIMGGTATTHDDILNNLEQVVIPTPATGDYTVRIMVKGPVGQPNTPVDAAGNVTDQWVSVILTGVESPYSEPFNLTGLTPAPGGFYTITIQTVPGGIYKMQRSNDLVVWSDTTNINMSARTHTMTVSEGTPPGWTNVFWRAARQY